MFNIRAFTVGYGVQEFEQMTVCNKCRKALLTEYPDSVDDFEMFSSKHEPWMVGGLCGRCNKHIGGIVGRIILAQHYDRVRKVRDARIALHNENHVGYDSSDAWFCNTCKEDYGNDWY